MVDIELGSGQGDGNPVRGISGSLITLILGGVILWVGQTTFHHNGVLSGIDQQLSAFKARHETLREQYDEIVSTLNERTRSRFTREDAAKFEQRTKELELSHMALKDKVHDRVSALNLQLASVETHVRTQSSSSPNMAAQFTPSTSTSRAMATALIQLRGEVDRLRSELNMLRSQQSIYSGHFSHPGDADPSTASYAPGSYAPISR